MAQRVDITLVDDIDGTEAEETVSFALDGTSYEIDLSADNAAALRGALEPFVTHARRVSRGAGNRRRGSAPGTTNSGSASRTKEVREWAKAQGLEVSERGRISADVQQAYDAAH